MSVPSRVKQLIMQCDMTQKKFAESIDISPARLNNYLASLSKIPQDILVRISELHHVNLNWLITGKGPMFQELIPMDASILEDTIRLPISAEIAAGEPCEVVLDEPLGYLNIPRSLLNLPPPYFMFRVKGRSMEPHILHGDIVICSQTYPAPHELSGKIMAFRTHDGITLKKLFLDDKNRIMWLMPINHEFSPVPYDEDGEEIVMIGLLDIAIRSFNRE